MPKVIFFFFKFLYGILGQLAHMLWQLPVSELFMHKYKHSLCQLENKSPRDSSALTTECYSLLQGLHLPNGGLFTEWSITWKRPRSKRKKKKKGGAYTVTITVGGSSTISQQALMINARRREYWWPSEALMILMAHQCHELDNAL